MKWSQTLDHPVDGRWERLRTVRSHSCGWEHPVLGWPAREAAVNGYCGVLHGAARRRAAATGATPLSAGRYWANGPDAVQHAVGSPGTAGAPAGSSSDGVAAQQLTSRMTRQTSAMAARVADISVAPPPLQQGDGLAAGPVPQSRDQHSLAGPGFQGLSLCLFKRMPRGETLFRRG